MSQRCVDSKCKKEMSQVNALTAASKKISDEARALMEKGNTKAAQKLSQEAWDSMKKPAAMKILAATTKCAVTKCAKEIRAEKQEQLKRYEAKCKAKPGSFYCDSAADLKKELSGNASGLKYIGGKKKKSVKK
jgi:hypothetical protein